MWLAGFIICEWTVFLKEWVANAFERMVASGAEIGCRGGNRYFEGVKGFLEIPKAQKMGFA